MAPQFKYAAMGGTFDHLHAGHQHFIDFTAVHAERVLIGLTTQKMITEKILSSGIQSYEERELQLREYCANHAIKAEIVPLADLYGPTIEGPSTFGSQTGSQSAQDDRDDNESLSSLSIDCLSVTEFTQQGGAQINQERIHRGLPELPIQVCSMLRNKAGEVLNSTDIRLGRVNRVGEVYSQLFSYDLLINPEQREYLQQLQGDIVQQAREGSVIAVVGDVCLETFLKNNWRYNLGVFDRQSERQEFHSRYLEELTIQNEIQNQAGTISKSIAEQVLNFVDQFVLQGNTETKHWLIKGEEDLIALVLIMLLPLGSLVYYGQPGEGMVEVVVSEEKKQEIFQLLAVSG